jgi:hypothetical protein
MSHTPVHTFLRTDAAQQANIRRSSIFLHTATVRSVSAVVAAVLPAGAVAAAVSATVLPAGAVAAAVSATVLPAGAVAAAFSAALPGAANHTGQPQAYNTGKGLSFQKNVGFVFEEIFHMECVLKDSIYQCSFTRQEDFGPHNAKKPKKNSSTKDTACVYNYRRKFDSVREFYEYYSTEKLLNPTKFPGKITHAHQEYIGLYRPLYNFIDTGLDFNIPAMFSDSHLTIESRIEFWDCRMTELKLSVPQLARGLKILHSVLQEISVHNKGQVKGDPFAECVKSKSFPFHEFMTEVFGVSGKDALYTQWRNARQKRNV